jgi:hypothetical protein
MIEEIIEKTLTGQAQALLDAEWGDFLDSLI